MIAVVPIICLPKVLPESLKWHRNRLVETSQAGRRRTPECCGLAGTNKTAALYRDAPLPEESSLLYTSITTRGRGPLWYKLWLDVRHIPIAIYRILTNAPFMLITLAIAIDSLVVTGTSSFMSKYLERQFNVPPSRSSLLIGCIMVPMAGVGCMISGFIVQYFRLNCVTTLKLAVGLLFVSLVLTPMYLIYCPHDPLVGVETTYPDRDGQISIGNYSDIEPSLRSPCNSHCLCSEAEFRPVCAEFVDGRQLSYYSPCFAGCSEPYTPMQKIYSNCSCVVETARLHVKQVKKGLCESKCKGLLGFLIMFAPLSLCTFAVVVPVTSVILRTVDYNERSFALGIQGILVRAVGTIPAPVLFGWMFDSDSCLLYSNKLLADLFLTFSIIGQVRVTSCY
ncbi:sodium-independent organic anion transporter, partial [Cooperia oncophora]